MASWNTVINSAVVILLIVAAWQYFESKFYDLQAMTVSGFNGLQSAPLAEYIMNEPPTQQAKREQGVPCEHVLLRGRRSGEKCGKVNCAAHTTKIVQDPLVPIPENEPIE